MNNEIKKILDYIKVWTLKKDLPFIVRLEEHITNLQEENERLETNLGELQNAIDNIGELLDVPEGMSVEDVYDKVKDYKSRIDKAIEYIEPFVEFDTDIMFKGKMIAPVLDILRGDKE